MALPIVGALAQQAGFNYFYGKQVDKTETAIRHMTEDVYRKALSIIATGSGTLTLQQLDAVNHLLFLLQNFQAIYSNEMNKTINKIDEVAKQRLAQLDSLVYKWTKDLLQDNEIQAQLNRYEALAHAFIAVAGGKPVLTDVFPICISPLNKLSHISLQCKGFFPYAANPFFKPTLLLKGEKFSPVKNISTIEFAIPYSLLFSEENQPFTSIKFNVRVPYLDKGWIYNSSRHSDYKGWISLLPNSPGVITLQYTVIKEVKEMQPRINHFWQNSKSTKTGGSGQSEINRPYALHAGEGWNILPGSAQIQIPTRQGKGTSAALHSEGPAAAIFVVTTHAHKKNKNSGRIECTISATAFRISKVFEEKTEKLNLKWGDSFELDPSIYNDWKVSFEAFNGAKTEYKGNADDTFISIQSPQGIPILKVKVPQTLPNNLPSRLPIRANM